MSFPLRDFRSGDLDTLWRIDQQCFIPEIAYSMADLRAYLGQPGAFTLLAEPPAGGEIPGFIIAQAVPVRRGAPPVGYIITIDVLASARRTGLGSHLLLAAEQRLQSVGCRKVVLESAVNNASALVFYKRHGYSIVATHAGYYANGLDAYGMEKIFL